MTTTFTAASSAGRATRPSASRWLLYGLGALLLLVFFTVRLETYPDPWTDETEYMLLAKTYAQTGIYAKYTSAGYDFTGPVLGTGPTVIVPIAVMFNTFGISMTSARLVIVVYGILTLLVLAALARNLFGAPWGLVAAGLLVFSHAMNMQFYMRVVMGEVPGLFFLLAALWLWWRQAKPGILALVGVGVLFGLASMTKNQYAIFILPGLLLAFVLDVLWYRSRPWLYFIIPGVVAGAIFFAWTYYAFYLLGAEMRDVQADLAAVRALSSSAFFFIDPEVNMENLYYFFGGKAYGGLLLPALLLGLLAALPRHATGQQWSQLAVFLLANTIFFIFSLGWPRLAMPGLGLGVLFVVLLLKRVTTGLREQPIPWRSILRGEALPPALVVALLLAAFTVLAVIVPIVRDGARLALLGSGSAQAMAQYIRTHVPADALIETWEYEQAVLTPHTYHHPPTKLLALSNRQLMEGGQLVSAAYDFRAHNDPDPDYVVNGPLARQFGAYPPAYLVDYTLVATFGEYELYQHNAP